MITTTGPLRERVERLVSARVKDKGGTERALYRWLTPPGPVTVRETEHDGAATVEITLPHGCECLELWLPTGLFRFLDKDKNADGALLIVLPDGSLEAHVCECKKTVNSSTWRTAHVQMLWTLTKLQALAGALGKMLDGAVFYTAFRADSLSEEESPNPAYAERIVGDPEGDVEAELTASRRRQLEWMRGRIQLDGFASRFVHRQIRLDQAGYGNATLALGAR